MPADRDFARLKRLFFSNAAVTGKLDRKTRRVLSKFGAWVRQAAQTSMRPAPAVEVATGETVKGRKKAGAIYRDAVAPPGSPPFTHKRRLLRKLLFFSFDPSRKSVVVGPVRLAETALQGVPRLQEEGGTAARKLRGGKTVVGRYAPHPYMRPAFERNLGWVASEYLK